MILVAGATGLLGSEIVRRLRERDHSVRALVRSSSAPERVEQLAQCGAEIARGDLRNAPSLGAACQGIDSVISTVSMIRTAQEGDSFADTDEAGTRRLIDAAARAGVRHFTFVSFDVDHAPDSPLAHAKREVETYLRASGMEYTILRPGLFMEVWLGPMLFADPATGTAKVYGDGSQKLRYVAVADVAELAVQSVTNPAARNAILSFGGPEEISQREAVRLFEESFGKPFEVSMIPEAALEAQWKGADDPFQKTYAGLMLGVARGFGGGIPTPPTSFPIHMTSVHDYVERMARRG